MNNSLVVKGFELSQVLGNQQVFSFVTNFFAPDHIGLIRSITYVDVYRTHVTGDRPLEVVYGMGLYTTGVLTIDNEIEIYRQSPGGSTVRAIKDAIAYQVARAVYDDLPDELRREWERTSNEGHSIHDFCVSYTLYYFRPSELLDDNPGAYGFFEKHLAPSRKLSTDDSID